MKLLFLVLVLLTFRAQAQVTLTKDSINLPPCYIVYPDGTKTYYDTLYNKLNDIHFESADGEKIKVQQPRSVVCIRSNYVKNQEQDTGMLKIQNSFHYHQMLSFRRGKINFKQGKLKLYNFKLATDTLVEVDNSFGIREVLFYDSVSKIMILKSASSDYATNGTSDVAGAFYLIADEVMAFYSWEKNLEPIEWFKSKCTHIPDLNDFFKGIDEFHAAKNNVTKRSLILTSTVRSLRFLYWSKYYVEL